MLSEKRKILIAGGSYSDIPLIKEAKKLGFYVITSGNRPEDLGHKYGDEYRYCDFADRHSLLLLAKDLKIDAIVPSCHDLSMVSCAYVVEKLNLPGYDPYEITLNLHHKDRFRKIANNINLLSPKSISVEDKKRLKEFYDIIPLPCIIKPVDLGGGKGISVIHEKDNIQNAVDYAFDKSKIKKIVIEEYVKGSLHSFSTFIRDRRVVFYFCDNEYSSVNPYGVSTSTSPMKDFKDYKKILIEQTEKVASHFNLKDGLLHLQFLKDTDGHIYIVEFTRRMPGDWYSLPVKMSTGVDHAYWTLQGFLNGDFEQLKHREQIGYYSRHCLMANKNGKIESLLIDEEIKENIVDHFLWIDRINKVENYIYDKFGLYFLKYDSIEEMENKTSRICKLIRLNVI